MQIIEAVYEKGVFRPLERVNLSDGTRVRLELRIIDEAAGDDMDAIYEILDRRHSTGYTDTAARHNEHQP
jgi:predicted DNA-binding antitoxin AbrB/MazE fold protein